MPGILDPFGDPATSGLLGLASGLLQAGGPSPYPRSFGQALGAGFGGMAQAQHAALTNQMLGQQSQHLGALMQSQQRQQAAIEDLASQLPMEKRAMFLSDPAAYIKSISEPYTLAPGQTRYQGAAPIASSAPNLQFQNVGGSTVGVNPQTGVPVGAPLEHTLKPESVVISPTEQANLYIKAASADPLGMFGLKSIVDRAVTGSGGKPSMQPSGQPGTPTLGGGAVPSDLHGEDYLSHVPKPIGDQVKALAEGRMQFPGGFALKSPYWQSMMSMVSQYDPNFDMVNYQARAATRKDFTSGASAKNVTSINTVIGHMDSLDKAIDSLGNNDYPAFNYAMQKIGPTFGGAEIASKIRTFQQAKEAVSNELMRVFRGTGASTADTMRWAETIGQTDSPKALKAAVHGAVDLLDSRIQALDEQYKRGMGSTANVMDLVNPKSRQALDRLRGEAQTSAGAIRTVTRTGTLNGKKVIQYSDGSVEYAQ